MGRGTLIMAVFQIESEDVRRELISAFSKTTSVAPTLSEDEAPYGYEWRFKYLSGKSWQEVAANQRFLARHIREEFYFMPGYSLLYFLPGFLIGTLVHRETASMVGSLAEILQHRGSWSFGNEQVFLRDELDAGQKRATVHWLMIQINRVEEEIASDDLHKKSPLWEALSRKSALWDALRACEATWAIENGEREKGTSMIGRSQV
jgi:hypothetical protein